LNMVTLARAENSATLDRYGGINCNLLL
jgi:hypothetical protein